jgi:hypothetical protein
MLLTGGLLAELQGFDMVLTEWFLASKTALVKVLKVLAVLSLGVF